MDPKQVAPPDRPEPTPRYFRHVEGFSDDTAFVCIHPDGSATLLFKTGGESVPAHTYTLEDSLDRVDRRIWEEVSPDVAVPARAHQEEKEQEDDDLARSGTPELRRQVVIPTQDLDAERLVRLVDDIRHTREKLDGLKRQLATLGLPT